MPMTLERSLICVSLVSRLHVIICVMAYKNPLYKRWTSMKQRCNNPNSTFYSDYGGRGIKVCEQWATFKNFQEDMESSFSVDLSLDRIDNDKDYTPDNCRWATHREQINNRRVTKFLTFEGQRMPLTMWADKIGIKKATLKSRIYMLNWPLERCLSTTVRKKTN